MSYNKTTWVNDETPLNAENMNNIEQGIENLQVLQGTSAPDLSITAEIGQFYLDTVNKKLYQYVATNEWQEVGANGEKKLYSHDIYLRYIDQRIKGRYVNNRKEAFTSEEDLAAYLVSQGNPVINTYSSSMYYLGETQDIVIGFTASTDSNKIILLALDITRQYNTITIDNSDIKNVSKYNIQYEQKNASIGYLTDTVTEL